MLCNEILYVLGREMTGGLADEGPALFNYAAAFLDEDNTVTASGPRPRLRSSGNSSHCYTVCDLVELRERQGHAQRLVRMSHTTKRIGAPNQRKWLCGNDFRAIRGAPRCRQSVAQICSDLQSLKAATLWWHSTAGRSARMRARCFWGRRI